MIHFNNNPSGRLRNFRFALVQLADGLVRTLSLGFFFTDWPLNAAKRDAKERFKHMKKGWPQ